MYDSRISLLEVLLTSMLGLFSLAFGVVFIFIIYQRKLLAKDRAQRELENRYQKDLLQAALKTQENERHRIARDLHDEIGVLLTTTKMYLGQITPGLTAGSLNPLTKKMDSILTETINNVRRIAHDLRPIILENLGFGEAVENLAQKITGTGQARVSFTNLLDVNLAQEPELMMYRIVQELITNTLKHAHAKNIDITVGTELERFYLEYHDDGIGILNNCAEPFSGLGMKSIESRLNILAGNMTILKKNKGTNILIEADVKRLTHHE
jgi:signal transduction histidine kinase